MMRKYKSWRGLALATLLTLIMMYALIILLINSYVINRNLHPLIVIILIVMVVGIVYLNFITLQLSHRLKEFYVRKLLGASDKQLLSQLLLESIVLSVFLVVSGMVLAELVSPFSEKIIGVVLETPSTTILGQVLVVVILVLPAGMLTAILPIRAFLNYLKTNFSRLSQQH